MRGQRNPVALRFDPEQTAPARRDADRAAAVGAQCQRCKPGGHRGPAAAAAAAGRQRGVPRIAGRPERQRFGEREDHQFGHSGFAEDHRAGRAQPADDFGIVGRRGRDRAAAARREFAGHVVVVLDRDRDTEQRQPLAGIEASLRGQRFPTRGLGQHHTVAAQLRVQARDAVQVDLQQRRRGDGGGGQHPRLLGGSREGQISYVHVEADYSLDPSRGPLPVTSCPVCSARSSPARPRPSGSTKTTAIWPSSTSVPLPAATPWWCPSSTRSI